MPAQLPLIVSGVSVSAMLAILSYGVCAISQKLQNQVSQDQT